MKQIILKNVIVLLSIAISINTFGHIQEDKGYFKGHRWEITHEYGYPDLLVDGRMVLSHSSKFIMISPWQVGDDLFFKVTTSPGKEALFDIKGNRVIPYDFFGVGSLEIGNTHLLIVNKGSLYLADLNLYSTKGELIVADVYSNSSERYYEFIAKDAIYGEIFRVNTKDGYGVYNTKGESIIPAKYKKIEWTKDEDDNVITYEITNNNNYIGIMDRNKNWIVPLNKQFKEIKRILLGEEIYFLCRKLENNDWAYSKYALYNNKSNEVLPPNYSSISSIDIEGTPYLKCYKDGYCGLYDSTGKEVISPDYKNLQYLGSNYIGFQLNEYWGVMTMQGKVIIPTSRRYTNIGRYIKNQKRFTYSMDGFEGECNHLGQQISKRRVAKPKPSVSSSTSSNTSSSGSSSSNSTSTSNSTLSSSSSSSNNSNSTNTNSANSTTTVVVEQHGPVQVWVACGGCQLSPGRCSYCNGSGWGYNNRLCSRCNGTGKCTICNGTGGHNEVQYR